MGIKYNIQFKGAREGNLKVVGCVKPVAAILRGTIVGGRGLSCADQLAGVLEMIKAKSSRKAAFRFILLTDSGLNYKIKCEKPKQWF